ncbi:PEP-CTERM sorting domain-containing protein [Verrucomicrobiaceae bacterium 227]
MKKQKTLPARTLFPTNKITSAAATGLGMIALGSPLASATTLLQIDYQMTGGIDQGSEAGWTAQDVAKTTQGATIVTSVGGIDLTLTANGAGGVLHSRGGTSELRSTEISGTSWNDMVEDLVTARDGDGSISVTIAGLSLTDTHTLTVWHNDSYNNAGAPTNEGFASGLYSVTPSVINGTLVGFADPGAASHVRDTAPADDSQFNTSIISFMADGGGNATINLTAGSGSFVAISGLQLDSVPEPSSTLLMGLSVLGLALRRRR